MFGGEADELTQSWETYAMGNSDRFVLDFKKAKPLQSEDGVLTKLGQTIVVQYAKRWVEGSVRDLTLERQYPDLAGVFYDLRADPFLATSWVE